MDAFPTDIEQLETWRGWAGGVDVRHFVSNNVSVGEALVFSAALWPGFVEHAGCVFVDFLFSEKSVQEFGAGLAGADLELMINHLHLWDIFQPEDPGDYGALETMAATFAKSWQAAAEQMFPGRKFRATVAQKDEDYGPTVSLCSV